MASNPFRRNIILIIFLPIRDLLRLYELGNLLHWMNVFVYPNNNFFCYSDLANWFEFWSCRTHFTFYCEQFLICCRNIENIWIWTECQQWSDITHIVHQNGVIAFNFSFFYCCSTYSGTNVHCCLKLTWNKFCCQRPLSLFSPIETWVL